MTITEGQEGTYRIEVLGAGQKNGGFWCRILTEISLKMGDKLKVAVGQKEQGYLHKKPTMKVLKII